MGIEQYHARGPVMILSAAAVDRLSVKNPYKFLEYFDETDQLNFAGRNREIREVVAGILRGPTFVLYGRSGLGKTSLLKAGIFPELRKRNHRPVYIRTLVSPIADLYHTVAEAYGKPPANSMEELQNMLKGAPKEETVVLVLDQFEEFFIRFRQNRRAYRNFIRAMETILKDNSLRIRVLFSLREDYLAQMEDFYGHLPGLFENDFRLLPLSAYGTRRAVSQPLINAQIKYEQKLIVNIVDQLDGLRFDPPLLQVICTEIFRQAVQRNADSLELKNADLQKVGGLDGIFRRYLDAFIKEVPVESHLVARTLLDALITQENTKQAVTLSFFRRAGFEASEQELTTILDLLVYHSLVRRDPRGGDIWYELLHERLVAMIVEWLDLDQEFFKFRFARDLITNCSKGEVFRANHELLLNEGQIKGVVGPYKDRLKLNPLETEFMAQSVIYRQSPATDISGEVDFWCKQFGADRSCRLLLNFFDDSDETARLGAASSSIIVGDIEGRLSEKCFGLALKDPSGKVRRTAGFSFVRLADDHQLSDLMEALNQKETRRSALDVLADMHQSGRSMAAFNWFWRRRGKATFEKRVLKKHRNDIHERGKAGALAGLLAGLAWAFTVGIGLTLLFMWALAGGREWIMILSTAMGTILPIALALGTWSGYSSARKAARAAATGTEGQWFRVLVKPGVYFWILFGVSSLIFMLIFKGADIGENLGFGGMILLWIFLAAAAGGVSVGFLYALIAGYLRAIQNCVWPGVHRYNIWFWAFISSVGIPLFVPALMLTVQGYGLSSFTDNLFFGALSNFVFFLAVIGGPLFSFLVFTISAALAVSAEKVPMGRTKGIKKNAQRISRAITILSFLGFAVWFGWMYGFDTIPFRPFAHAIAPMPAQEIKLASKLGPGIPDTDYYAIPYITRYKVVRVVNDGDDVSMSIHGNKLGYLKNKEMLLCPWFHNLALSYDGRTKDPRGVVAPIYPEVRFTLFPVQNLGESIPLNGGNIYYIKECRMTRKMASDPTIWQGSIQSGLEKSSATDGSKIAVFIPKEQYMVPARGILEINSISIASYEGQPSLNLRNAHARKPLPIDEPTGVLEPDPSGHWGLNFTIGNLTDTELITSFKLIVLFQIAP